MTLGSGAFEVNRWHSAEYVDSWMSDPVMEAERRSLRRRLVSLLPFDLGCHIRVLDVGAGTGGLSVEIMHTYFEEQLVCHDFSEAMLTHARQQLSHFSERVVFVKSDLRDPAWLQPIEGTFDAVVSSFVMHTVPDRVRDIYRDIFQLVKPGCCFLTCDLVAPPGPALGKAYLRARVIARQAAIKAETGVEKSLQEVEQELLERRRSRRALFPDRVRNEPVGSLTIMNQLGWLEQAGFDEVDCLWKDMRRAIVGGFRHGGQ